MKRFLSIITLIVISAGAFIAPAQVSAEYLAYVDSADNYLKRERYDDAERVILKALRTEPANPSNYLLFSNLGIVRSHLGNIEGALEAYDIGLARAPKSTALLTNRARTYLMANRKDEALADFNTALEKDSLLEWPLKMRGYLLLSKGYADEAKKDFSRLLRNYPKETDALMGLGKVALFENDRELALSYFKEALDKNPDEDAYMYVASTLLDMDKLPEAIEVIRNGLKKYPMAGNLFLMRARWHKQNYRNEDASVDKKLAVDNGADAQLIEQYFRADGK